MDKNDSISNKQAFPFAENGKGMTLLEWYAGQALIGASRKVYIHNLSGERRQDYEKEVAELAVKMAKATIEELEKNS